MVADGRTLYFRLLRYAAPYWRVFSLAILSLVVLAATEPAMPALLKPILDDGFVDKDLDAVRWMAIVLVLIFLVRGAAAYASAFAMAWVAAKVVMDLRNEMFRKLLVLPSSYFDAQPSGNLISKITFDANQVTEAASYVVTVLVKDALAIVGLLAWMLYLDWKLTMITLTTAPIVVFVVQHFSHRLRAMSHNLQRTMGEITQAVDEAIEGEKVVRVFGGQDYERQRFGHIANWVRRYQVKFASASSAVAPIATLAASVAAGIILYVAAHQAVADKITIGGFASFFTAMMLLFSPLKRLTGVNGRLQKGLAGAESVFSLIDHPSEPDEGTRTLDHARGRIEVHDVTFQYDEASTPALEDINLTIEPGETVALVGSSGSGKTTLINLIPRFYHPNSGQILIDGIDIESIRLASLRHNIALVSQDVVLFDDTLAVNIAYGPLTEASRERVLQAANSANAADFIRELPEGLDTRIGENGVRLSGGQRQRIAIARAFLKDPPILILDEATSSLDTVSEQQIQAALETLRRGRTTIIIAHKLSTIEKADRIVVMSAGRIVATGKHAQLLRENSLYAALYRFQFASPADASTLAGAHGTRG